MIEVVLTVCLLSAPDTCKEVRPVLEVNVVGTLLCAREAIRRMGGTPPQVFDDPELRAMLLPLLRADFTLCDTYSQGPGPPLRCPLFVYGGQGDAAISREQLQAWAEHTAAGFLLRMFPGDHFFLQGSREALLRCLAQDLATLEPAGREGRGN